MSKYMSDEEFSSSNIISYREISDIRDVLESKGITNLTERIDYVKENYSEKTYVYFMLEELDNKILMNYREAPEECSLSIGAIDGILRAFLFASKYMQDRLPEHAYKYIISKSSTFVYELEEQLKDIK
ncbi:hypothetical protein LPC13_05455 [Clostridium celatum]|uniref:hypothetical protein n=1 Tax=Clostridium celatum TaxID=36834 RepID=UPI001F45DBEF|nr:hypothetical protein [Clostridium celatum]MCE9654721.1 hypothetical protein [Clostridium celatum]